MRVLVGASLLVLLVGCRSPALEELLAEPPLRALRPLSGGRHGAFLEDASRPRPRSRVALAEGTRVRWLEGAPPAEPQRAGEWVYGHEPAGVVRWRLAGDALTDRELVVARPEVRQVCAGAEGDLVVASCPRGVLAAQGGVAREVWRGDALAIALDEARDAVWIAAAAPLPTIDLVGLADGRVLLRTPLPTELEVPSLQIVVSGPNVALYDPSGAVEETLFVWPEAGLALARGAFAQDGPRGHHDPLADPPLLCPPARAVAGERVSLATWRGEDEQDVRARRGPSGRVAPFPEGGFLLLREGAGEFEVVGLSGDPARPWATRRPLPTPPLREVQALCWDADGVTLVSAAGLDRLTPRSARRVDNPIGRLEGRGALRTALLVVRAGIETAGALVINVVASALALPVGLLATPIVGRPALIAASALLWFPWTYTFGLDPF